MKIAHVAIATPGRCGLYETTRDLVAHERKLGADARIVDPCPGKHVGLQVVPGQQDRGVPVEGVMWAKEADVIVDHSGTDAPGLTELVRPFIMVSHGRPASSFNGEREGRAPVISYWYKKNRDPRYRAVITFWPEHVPYLAAIWQDTPVEYVPPPVDLEYWKPGVTTYAFAGRGGAPNVMLADVWRDDVTPFPCLTAFLLFADKHPNAKLHIYGLPPDRRGINTYLRVMQDRKILGVAQGWTKGLIHAYRAADLVISPQTIYTRSLREAIACGCRVVSGRDVDPQDVVGFAQRMTRALEFDPAPVDPRNLFDPLVTARRFLAVAAVVSQTRLKVVA